MAPGTFKLGVEDTSISPQTLGHSLEEFPLYVEGEYVSLSLELSKGWRGCLRCLLRALRMDVLNSTKEERKRKESEKKGKAGEKKAP